MILEGLETASIEVDGKPLMEPTGEPTGEPTNTGEPKDNTEGEPPVSEPTPGEMPPVEGAEPTGEPKPTGEPEGLPAEGEPTPPEPTEVLTMDQMIENESKGEYKSYQEVVTAMEDLKETQSKPSQEYENDVIDKFIEFSKNNSISDSKELAKAFLSTQMDDFNTMSSLDVLEKELRLKHPSFSSEDAKAFIANKYQLDEDGDEHEQKMIKMNMDIDAGSARKELLENQQKLAISNTPQSQQGPTDEQIKETQAIQEKWESDLTEMLDDVTKIEIPIGDDKNFNFEIENKEEVKGLLVNTQNFWNQYINEDKSVNKDKLRTDMYHLTNKDKIYSELLAQGESIGREKLIAERKNVTPPDAGGQAPPKKFANKLDAIGQAMIDQKEQRG